MVLQNLPKMFYSCDEGWPDVVRMHPTVAKMFLTYVMPMSLIPAAMFVYSMFVTPGAVFPETVPPFTGIEAATLFLTFYAAQLLMVPLMASIIQQMGDVVKARPDYQSAFMLAAIAPTPLWLGALVLFVPSVWLAGIALAVAWVASAALIYHGVEPLFQLNDHSKSRLMGSFVLTAGVVAWFALMVLLALALSMIIGLR
ncbi:MAG: Yip1 family protein [Azoarcus sp.]|nr:Yip1 family protein [Azoarcus sp.]